MRSYVAQWPIEQHYMLPAVGYSVGTERAWRRWAHVKVEDVQPGDILVCNAAVEITNDLVREVEVACCLVLTPSETGTAGLENMNSISSPAQPAGGVMLTRCPAENVDNVTHHKIYTRHAVYNVPDGIHGDFYVALIGYVGAGANNNSTVQLEPYCGDMSVVVL